jgi:hypothetical protein
VIGGTPREPISRRNAVGWGLVALGLVTVVAMEANGAAWSTHRGGQVHSLPRGVIVAGAVSAAVAATVLFALAVVSSRGPETPEKRRRRWATAIAFLVALLLVSIGRIVLHPSRQAGTHAAPEHVTGLAPPAASGSGGRATGHTETWWPLVVVGLGTAAAFAVALTRHRAALVTSDAGTDADLAAIALLDASFDDLRRETDPRRAVTAAYARTERGLAARGFARRPSETPTEYFRRALFSGGDLQAVAVEPLRELTELAELARFSARPVDEAMRERAITALETLRRDLRNERLATFGPVG